MTPGSDGWFDESRATAYDRTDGKFDPAAVEAEVDFLADLAGAGPALEFAIGTGRIALPLAARGIPVHGIDLSRPMLAVLRAKPGGERIPLTVGDMARRRVDGAFAVVYLVFNTICNLTSQEDQIACFVNAARHLAPGGHFLIETFVPPLQRLPEGVRTLAFALSDEHWGIDEYDVATSALVSHHLHLTGGALHRHTLPFRYVWPSELDLMARIAGLSLVDRFGGWRREPFTGTGNHVSVWRKP